MPDNDGKRTGYRTGDASVPQTYDFHNHARSQQRAAQRWHPARCATWATWAAACGLACAAAPVSPPAYAIRRENKIGVLY